MLTKEAIKKAILNGDINITPFDEKNLNPNSYNMTIQDKIITYDLSGGRILDPKNIDKMPVKEFNLNDYPKGLLLMPGNIYLASTVERIHSKKFIPCITGRSSYARLGIEVHQTAFFANLGDDFNWTLEISVINPVLLYKDTKLSQLYFEIADGDFDESDFYNGKYKNQREATISRINRELI